MNVVLKINKLFNKSAVAGSRYSGGRQNGASSTNVKQNINDSINLSPDSASDLEAGIQESCSGIIYFNYIIRGYNIELRRGELK